MVHIQIDLPNEVDDEIKRFMLEKRITNKGKAIIGLLREAIEYLHHPEVKK